MRWLALLLVVVASADVAASPRCELAGPVLPVAGSVVPENARVWVAAGPPWQYTLEEGTRREAIEPVQFSSQHTPIVRLEPRLATDREHVLRDAHGNVATKFTVARGEDREAPKPPMIVVQRGHGQVTDTTLGVGDGTALIRLDRGRGTAWTTTMVLLASEHACDLELERAATGGCLRVTAFDLAGNASARGEVCDEQVIPVALISDPKATAAAARSASAFVVIGFIVALVIGFFIVFAPEIDMGWLRRRANGDDLLPAAARQVARTACHNAIVRAFGVVVGATGAIVFASPTLAAYVGLGATLLLLRQIWVYNRARRMLQLLADEPTVTLHGDHVLRVRSRGDFSWLVCSQRQLATATERVLPLARVL